MNTERVNTPSACFLRLPKVETVARAPCNPALPDQANGKLARRRERRAGPGGKASGVRRGRLQAGKSGGMRPWTARLIAIALRISSRAIVSSSGASVAIRPEQVTT